MNEILDATRDWPAAQRLTLAQRLLGTIETELPGAKPKKPLSGLVGILKTDAPPPTDEECDQIRYEELMKKHG